ncbi:MAG: CinA family protein, partial [Propionibacteriaceae bacterium]|nr:CinA family protein [Propionibacteriaceae bacterium]
GVDPTAIDEYSVVSEQVALAMAEGTRRVCQANWGIAVTGVAGPGPSAGVPAGTVWVAIVGPHHSSSTLLNLHGDRTEIRQFVVDFAIKELCELLARRNEPPYDWDSGKVE